MNYCFDNLKDLISTFSKCRLCNEDASISFDLSEGVDITYKVKFIIKNDVVSFSGSEIIYESDLDATDSEVIVNTTKNDISGIINIINETLETNSKSLYEDSDFIINFNCKKCSWHTSTSNVFIKKGIISKENIKLEDETILEDGFEIIIDFSLEGVYIYKKHKLLFEYNLKNLDISDLNKFKNNIIKQLLLL